MRDVVALSRRLAYVLRHHPEAVGIALDGGGWVEVEALLAALDAHGHTVTRADLDAVLTDLPKQRFELRDGLIRAVQGHSIDVDLGLAPRRPPVTLYHGTVARFLDAIMAEGLRPGSRQHVHLSPDVATAEQVGSRRGQPVVLEVDARRLHEEGHVFLQATNGVWLTDHVPPDHLRTSPGSSGSTSAEPPPHS